MRKPRLIKGLRKNERHGSKREPVASTVTTPPTTAPLESARQVRALRGAKGFPYAVTSTARPTYAGPVQVLREAGQKRRKPRAHVDEPGRFTRNVGGSTPQEYVYGTG